MRRFIERLPPALFGRDGHGYYFRLDSGRGMATGLGLAVQGRYDPAGRQSVASLLRNYGPFAIAAYMLATARWGSYLLPGPPYIGDVAILLLLGERAIAGLRGQTALGRVELSVGLACGSLLLWSSLRLVFGSFSANAARDFAPYAYAILVFLTPAPTMSDLDRNRMQRVLLAALFFHTAWVTLVRLDRGFTNQLPKLAGGQSYIFEERPDVDATICAVFALVLLNRAISGRTPTVYLALVAWNAALLFTDASRAALAAAAVATAVLFLLTPARREVVRRHSPRVVVSVLVLAVSALAYAATHSFEVTRLNQVGGAFVPLAPTTGDPAPHATGTARARVLAWQAIERYLEEQRSRDWLGVGFGPDFLHDSGADQLLLGGPNQDVRQPHNYLINTWARLGLVGLLIVIAMLVIGIRLIAVVSARGQISDVDLVAMLLVCALPVAGIYGVVLESPFGALPYFWALGYLGTRALELRSIVPTRRA